MKTTPPNVRTVSAALEDAQEAQVVRAYATRWGPAIERTLREGLARELAPGALFRQPLEYVLASGGKRYRPLLTLAACELVGGEPSMGLEAASAIEYLHASSLLLDDLPCMDAAMERRGRPSLHRVFGEAETILVALLLVNLAHETLARTGPNDCGARERFHGRICQLIGPAGMVGGQQMDLWIARGAVLPSSREQQGQWLRKTSALITAALLAGAQVAAASQLQMQNLERFGLELGEAYQLADDALDVEEDCRNTAPGHYMERAHARLRSAMGILSQEFAASAALRTMTALAEVCVHRSA